MALDALGWVQVAACAAGVGLAVVTLRAAPGRPSNRFLALWIGLVAVSQLVGPVTSLLPDTREASLWSGMTFRALVFASMPVLLGFAGTLESPLARPFSSRAAQRGLLALAVAVVAFTLLFPGWIVEQAPQPTQGGFRFEWHWLPAAIGIILIAATLVYGAVLVIAADSLRRAPRRSLERTRAWCVIAAVALAEGIFAANALLMLALDVYDHEVHLAYMRSPLFVAWPHVDFVGNIVAFAILAYGMLRLQLFDVDLRVKWTLQRGTVLAIVLGAFLVVSQIAQEFLSETYGWAAGGLAAGALVFALHPLQRIAARVADTAMPDVRDTPEWRDHRKAELYRTAARLALSDGVITPEEEVHLADLATQLGLDARRALDLRREAEREMAA